MSGVVYLISMDCSSGIMRLNQSLAELFMSLSMVYKQDGCRILGTVCMRSVLVLLLKSTFSEIVVR